MAVNTVRLNFGSAECFVGWRFTHPSAMASVVWLGLHTLSAACPMQETHRRPKPSTGRLLQRRQRAVQHPGGVLHRAQLRGDVGGRKGERRRGGGRATLWPRNQLQAVPGATAAESLRISRLLPASCVALPSTSPPPCSTTTATTHHHPRPINMRPHLPPPPQFEYLWADGVRYRKPVRLSAPEYIDKLFDWVEAQVSGGRGGRRLGSWRAKPIPQPNPQPNPNPTPTHPRLTTAACSRRSLAPPSPPTFQRWCAPSSSACSGCTRTCTTPTSSRCGRCWDRDRIGGGVGGGAGWVGMARGRASRGLL